MSTKISPMQKLAGEGSLEECEPDWLVQLKQESRAHEDSYPHPGAGNTEAILADCFLEGRGVRQDYEQAACWYGQGARQAILDVHPRERA